MAERRYKELLLGLYDDFSRAMVARAGESARAVPETELRDYLEALAGYFDRAAWYWLALAWTLGKGSVHWSREDFMAHQWEVAHNRYYLRRPDGLSYALWDIIMEARRGRRSLSEGLLALRSRAGMYSGAFWAAIQQAVLRRPPVERRRKAQRFRGLPEVKWAFPAIIPWHIEMWRPPEEWGVPDYPDAPVAFADKLFLWVGWLDRHTCRGPNGCAQEIGRIHRGIELLDVRPGNRACLSNCRCWLVPLGDDETPIDDEAEYELPFERGEWDAWIG